MRAWLHHHSYLQIKHKSLDKSSFYCREVQHHKRGVSCKHVRFSHICIYYEYVYFMGGPDMWSQIPRFVSRAARAMHAPCAATNGSYQSLQDIIHSMITMISILSVVLVAAGVASFQYHDSAWNSWKEEYNRQYRSSVEELYRRAVFESNMKFVEEHNQRSEEYGFVVGMNEFADMVRDGKIFRQIGFFFSA